MEPEAKPIPDGQWDDIPGFNVGKEEYVGNYHDNLTRLG